MAQSIKENATRANAVPAGVAAGIVFAVMVVQAILRTVVGVFSAITLSGGRGSFYPGDVFAPVGQLVTEFGTNILPVTIGVFAAFWLIAPLTADLRVARVALRSLVAAGVASLLVLVFTSVYSGWGVIFGGGDFFYGLFGMVQSVLYTFIGVTPLVMLAGFLAWFWVSKGRPRASAL
jgi:hypothetical protein